MRNNRQVGYLHSHSESSFLRIVASERHPCNVEGMRESSECLGPNNSEVSHSTETEFSEDTIEDVAQSVHAQTSNDSLATTVAVSRQYAFRMLGSLRLTSDQRHN